jgi:hypothetical protein
MKKAVLLGVMAALAWGGCATSDDYRYSRAYRGDRYYVSEEHPAMVDRDSPERIYVRERYDYRGSADYQNNMEPRVRGKHAESLGWNTDNYYLQRGY